MSVRAHVFIQGDVTGVGYRAWAYRNARELELTGWVRNVSRGNVEAVLEGEKKNVVEMVSRCKKGPEVAWVNKVEVEWKAATGQWVEFSIKI